MRTTKLTSYSEFVNAGRPYYPVIDDRGRLLLPNFSTCSDNQALHHARRLVISSGVIYNRSNLTVGWVCSYSRFGFRWRWMYFRDNRVIRWFDLSWDEKRSVIRAYVKRQELIPFYYAPVKHYERWLS